MIDFLAHEKGDLVGDLPEDLIGCIGALQGRAENDSVFHRLEIDCKRVAEVIVSCKQVNLWQHGKSFRIEGKFPGLNRVLRLLDQEIIAMRQGKAGLKRCVLTV